MRETSSSALLSTASTTTTTIPITPVNLVVPIEMLQTGLESQATGAMPPAVDMAQSKTSLDPADYDGTVQYFFEIVAENTALGLAGVHLYVDGVVIPAATINVPNSPITHYRSAAWTPQSGLHTYSVALSKTPVAGTLKVYNARIIVKQSLATKTRIYVPLIADLAATTQNVPFSSATTRVGAGFGQSAPGKHSHWLRDNSKWGTITGFQFEAVALNVAMNPTIVSLFTAGGTQIASSTVSTNSMLNTLLLAEVPNGDLADSTEYEVRVDSPSGGAGVAKAGIWIKLQGIAKGEVYYNFGRGAVGPGMYSAEHSRAKVDLAEYSNGQFLHEAILYNNSGGPENIFSSVWEMAGTSTGTVSNSIPASDNWTALNGTHSVHRGLPFSVPGNNYFMSKNTYGNLTVVQHRLIVKFSY